jgi:O-antigen ligase
MRNIRSLASWISLPVAIGLACAFVWHQLTERWNISPSAVVGLALIAGGVAAVADRVVRRATLARSRRRLPASRAQHRKELA